MTPAMRSGPKPLASNCFTKSLEARVRIAPAVGEGNLHHVGIEVDDPLLERGNPADLLGAQGAAMERALVTDDRDLLVPPTSRPCVRASLIAHSTVSPPVVSRNTLSNPAGASSASRFTNCARTALGKQ